MILFKKALAWRYSLPLLSAALMGVSYIPFPPVALFAAWVPLWLFLLREKSFKAALKGCILCSGLATLIGFNWVAYTIHFFGGMPWAVSILGLAAFCLLANIYMALAGGVWFLIAGKTAPGKTAQEIRGRAAFRLLLLPLLFSLFHTLIPTVFPWNWGYSWFWAGFPAFQTAELWGFRFLNTLTYAFNLLFLVALHHTRRRAFKPAEAAQSIGAAGQRAGSGAENIDAAAGLMQAFRKPLFSIRRQLRLLKMDRTGQTALAAFVILFAALNIMGWILKARLALPDKSLTALVVQHNIGQLKHLKREKGFASLSDQVFFQLKELTYKGLIQHRAQNKSRSHIDFILWPEGAYPYFAPQGAMRLKRASLLAKRLQIPIITGAARRKAGGVGNSLIALNREGGIERPIYDKHILIAFGEYMPAVLKHPGIQKYLPYFKGGFSRGEGPQAVSLNSLRLGPQICYEGLFDFFSRGAALKGAEILVNVTNDSWYGSWQQPLQHLYMSLARAIEVRRPMLRAANTGFSSAVTAAGEVLDISPLNFPWAGLFTVPLASQPKRTVFMSWGFYINEIFLSALALAALFFFFKKRERKA